MAIESLNPVGLDPKNRLLDKNIAINLLNKIKTVNGYSPAAVSKLEEVEKKKAQRLRYSLSAFCCLHFVCHYHLHLNIPA